MARIKTVRGRRVNWEAADPKWVGQNVSFLRCLSKASDVELLQALNPYHDMLVVGKHRMPVPVFCKLLGFIYSVPLSKGYVEWVENHIDTAQAVWWVSNNWVLLKRPRAEVISGFDDHGIPYLRAWGVLAGSPWHVFATGDRPMESGSVTLWVGDTHQISLSNPWGKLEVEGELHPSLLHEWEWYVAEEGKEPLLVWQILQSMVPRLDEEFLPQGATGVWGSAQIRSFLWENES